jgi:hypothetical protein
MQAAEVGQRLAVDDRARGRAQAPLDDLPGVGAGHRVHGVEAHAEAAPEQAPDPLEVEQPLHQGRVVRDGVDDLDHRVAEARLAEAVEVEVGLVEDTVLGDGLGAREDRLGHLLGCGTAIPHIVLDAEVAVGAARIVARGQDEAAIGLARPDHRRGRRGRQDAAAADHDPPEPVRGGHLQDGLDGLPVVVPAVAADHQDLSRDPLQAVEDGLHEVLDVMGPAEDLDLLAEARGAWLLPLDRGRLDRPGRHCPSPRFALPWFP